MVRVVPGGRVLAAALVALCWPLTACSDDGSTVTTRTVDRSSEDSPSDDDTTSPSTEETLEASPDSDVIDFDDPLDLGGKGAWAMPVLSGWSIPTLVAAGAYQIAQDGTSALITGTQYEQEDGGAQEQAKAFLETYHSSIGGAAESVSTPVYDTRILPTIAGDAEFVSQELEYLTPDGVTYRSLYVGRHVDGVFFGLQYAAPDDDWSEDVWTDLVDGGLKLVP